MARTGNTEKWLRGDNTVNIFYAIYLYTKFDLNGNSSYTVICKVTKSSETTEWANSKVVVDKLIKLRMCLDPKDLNKYLQGCHYQIPTISEDYVKTYSIWSLILSKNLLNTVKITTNLLN